MYYELYCETPEDDDGGYAEIEDEAVTGVKTWISGRPLGVGIDQVLEFEVVPEDGYTGPVIEMYHGQVFLMSERLVVALEKAGVDNLETYPVLLTNSVSSEQLRYRAVNIIGLVEAADLDKSEWENFDGEAKIDTFFDKLVVDPERTNGLLLFRLAESLATIVVHEKVKEHIIKSGIETMTFLDVN